MEERDPLYNIVDAIVSGELVRHGIKKSAATVLAYYFLNIPASAEEGLG